MSENRIEEIMSKDLSIRFDVCVVDDDENEEEAKVFELKRKYSKMSSKMLKELAEMLNESEELLSKGYNVNDEREVNSLLLKEKMEEYGGDFCFDLNILSHGKKIGRISLTRIFVEGTGDILGFIDCESPQSMDIAHYICDVDYEKVYDTYVAIYDCFVLDEEYQGIGIEREVIDMLDSFLIEYEFDVSKTYIKAISISHKDYGKDVKSGKMLKILEDNEYVLEDPNNYIMCSDFWDFEEYYDYL